MRRWLMKSEPDEVSISHLASMPSQTVAWFGVRNHQARNFMRDDMQVGDLAFFYHSSCPEPGIAGVVRVASLAQPDTTQFDPTSPYFDAKSNADNPRWVCVSVQLVTPWPLVSLAWLRTQPALADMALLQRGSRLSITPVGASHWAHIDSHRPQVR